MIARFSNKLLTHYDQATLLHFLNHPEDRCDKTIQNHVEECEECQSALEQLTDGDFSIDTVGELLRETEHSSQECIRVAHEGELPIPASYLDPTAHPGSLGKFDRYEILDVLGRGGMGVVLRAYDSALDRHCAVKVLAPEFAHSTAAKQRFSREAKSAAAVTHPNIIAIQTVDEHRGLPYLVMPVVAGQSLQQKVEQAGPLPILDVVRIALQTARGLEAAHAQGLVHRDIKPANILLENCIERVQITDFGLARAMDDASMTRSGVISGTPQYMSPEQARGDNMNHRSDLFSLGSVIYFMLTGHSPFRAETTMGVLNRICNDVPRRIMTVRSDVPDWLETIVIKLLEKQQEGRFQSAAECGEVLNAWLAHLTSPDSVPAPVRTNHPQLRFYELWTQRYRGWATALGCLVLCAGLAILAWQTQNGDDAKSKITGVAQTPSSPPQTATEPQLSKSASVLLAVNEDSIYQLKGDHVLEWIPSTRTLERPQGSHINSHGHIFVQEKDTIRLSSQGSGEKEGLYNILFRLLRVFPCDLVEVQQDSVWFTLLDGDFVVQKDAPHDQLLADFNRILDQEMQLGFRLEFIEEERDVWIVTGTFKPSPTGISWRRPEDKAFKLYGKSDQGNHLFNAGNFTELLKAFGSRTCRPVINRTDEQPTGFFGWQEYRDEWSKSFSALFPDPRYENFDLVREHFVEQTGLTIESRREPVRLLQVVPIKK
jgi:serine/threonine protein kinase